MNPITGSIDRLVVLPTLVALLMMTAGLFDRAWANPKPLQLPLEQISHKQVKVQHLNNNSKGYIGETITAILLLKDGWRQIDAKTQGNNGLDGLFVREIDDGYQVLITETKTNYSSYSEDQMSNEHVVDTLGQLFAIGAIASPIAKPVIEALKSGSPFVQKELWRPNLNDGSVVVSTLGPKGKKVATRILPDTERFVSSILLNLHQFDREQFR